MKESHKIVAEAIRVEYSKTDDSLCVVFEIIDEKLKSEIKKDWMKNIDLKLVNKNLVIEVSEK